MVTDEQNELQKQLRCLKLNQTAFYCRIMAPPPLRSVADNSKNAHYKFSTDGRTCRVNFKNSFIV